MTLPKGSVYKFDILEQPDTPVKYRAFFQLALFGGFRRGEILGLEWSDIDFDTGVIHIRRTVHYGSPSNIRKSLDYPP
ncbi:tyrosine-type recombinase/integrase [Ruminococcus albus]|uniref:tyrosine-type recombinase/integrase n=1 Tax=Ruminococcus albus TaxID=1264 RepID=UPI0009427911